MINGTCASRPFKFGTFGHKACDDLDITMKSARHPWVLGAPLVAIEFQATARPAHRYSSATFKYRDAWAVIVRGNYVFDRKSGPTHRLDLTFKEIGNAAARSLPHGIIGQSFTTNAPRRGKQGTSTPLPAVSPRAHRLRAPSREMNPCTRWCFLTPPRSPSRAS